MAPQKQSPAQNFYRIAKAVATNQLAKLSPSFYLKLTQQTGRGPAETETPWSIADYFRRCVADYFGEFGVPPGEEGAFLAGKTVLEYGPGNLAGVAFLLYAMGARKVYCVDKFPMLDLGEKNLEVIEDLLRGMTPAQQERAKGCFKVPGKPRSGFSSACLEYIVRPSGLSELVREADLVISRAVLELVGDLPATFQDMIAAMKPGGTAIHLVDLGSHGLHESNALDFLSFSPTVWSLMYSEKGLPNRWRIDQYRRLLATLPAVHGVQFKPTCTVPAEEIVEVRPLLDKTFADVGDQDLSCLGFWLSFRT